MREVASHSCHICGGPLARTLVVPSAYTLGLPPTYSILCENPKCAGRVPAPEEPDWPSLRGLVERERSMSEQSAQQMWAKWVAIRDMRP